MYESSNTNIHLNVVVYKGEIYTSNKQRKISLTNRKTEYDFNFKDMTYLNKKIINQCSVISVPVLFLAEFHFNIGHMLWDCMYPSWYSAVNKDTCIKDDDFIWMTKDENYKKYGNNWNYEIVEKFSGNSMITPKMLEKPTLIKKLICGSYGIGIGCVNIDMHANMRFKNCSFDYVEEFVNRFYRKYKIKRNNFINCITSDKNIIYVKNKRKQEGIEDLFTKLNNLSHNWNFTIVDWSTLSFYEQLKLLNNTHVIVCGVGTARTNTPFLPNGAIEVQTNNHQINFKDHIDFFDTHIGTISKKIKVFNIEKYSEKEAKNNTISENLENMIIESINNLPWTQDCENLPEKIKNFKPNQHDYKEWRKSFSNDVSDIMWRMNKQNKKLHGRKSKKIIFNDENKHENGHIVFDTQKEQECCEPIEMD